MWVILVITYGLYAASTLTTWKGHRWVPTLDVSFLCLSELGTDSFSQTINAVFTGICLIVITVSLLAVAAEGRRPASFVFTHYDWSYSG